MNPAGVPEILLVSVLSIFWLLPIVAAIWALVTLHRIRTGQQVLQAKVDSIERMLQRS